MRRPLRLLVVVIVCVTSLCAQQSPAFKRVQHLQRGVNAGGWFAQSRDYSPGHFRTYVTLDDLDRMKRMGLDNVRIPINPTIFCSRSWDQCEAVKILDQVVAHAVAEDLAVQIDIHPEADFKKDLATSDAAVERFSQLWGRIAEHFAKTNPDLVFFEIMNEPESVDIYRWTAIQERIIPEIRHYAPSHTIIVTGAEYSKVEFLIQLPQFVDGNLIFNFHYYDPHIFTHEGANWGPAFWARLHDLPFPPSQERLEKIIREQQFDDYTRLQILRYGLDHWDEQHIAAEIDFAAEWGKKHQVPLICNEFGAYRMFSQPDDRARLITAIRTALEKDKIGWTMWDYHTGFGMVRRENGQTIEDTNVLKALGLRKD